MNEDVFWKSSIEELTQGFIYDESLDEYICLICNQRFENGVIYPSGNQAVLYEARKAIVHHIREKHKSVLDYLLSMNKKYTGLTEHQQELLQYFKEGLTDKEIVNKLGGSASTIRNHRFKLKEKEKQAKVFLAMMKLLETEKQTKQEFVSFHKGAKMVDERYAVTPEEQTKILNTYFKHGLNGPLDSFPSKEKRKIIILQHILKRFDINIKYTEKEVNEVLKSVFHDFVTIRRYFIEYGFMDRSKDGSEYWIKQ